MTRSKYGYLRQLAIRVGREPASCPAPIKLSELGLTKAELDQVVAALYPEPKP